MTSIDIKNKMSYDRLSVVMFGINKLLQLQIGAIKPNSMKNMEAGLYQKCRKKRCGNRISYRKMIRQDAFQVIFGFKKPILTGHILNFWS